MQTKRKTNRLLNYNYSNPGFYFVTVCIQDKKCCLGSIENGKMLLNEFGELVEHFWKEIPKHYENTSLDIFQVMPNHIHEIVNLAPVGAAIGRLDEIHALKEKVANGRPYNSISNIIGSFKNITSKSIHRLGFMDFAWQKSFYDHILRKDESLENIREYIQNNPKQWELDVENPKTSKNNFTYHVSPKSPRGQLSH